MLKVGQSSTIPLLVSDNIHVASRQNSTKPERKVAAILHSACIRTYVFRFVQKYATLLTMKHNY